MRPTGANGGERKVIRSAPTDGEQYPREVAKQLPRGESQHAVARDRHCGVPVMVLLPRVRRAGCPARVVLPTAHFDEGVRPDLKVEATDTPA